MLRNNADAEVFFSVGYRNDRFFSHTNPYIWNVMQQYRCSPMLIFRAWATCPQTGDKSYLLLNLDQHNKLIKTIQSATFSVDIYISKCDRNLFMP